MAKTDLDDIDQLDDDDLDADAADDAADDAVDDDADDSANDDAADDKAKAKGSDKTEKRIRDLQSKLDKALAENSKLRKGSASQADGKGDAGDEPMTPKMQALYDQMVAANRTRFFESDPRFKAYKLSPSAISGESEEDMALSTKALTRLVDRIESGVRNDVLREHGFSPAPRDGSREPAKNYSDMSKEDFDKLVREAITG